VSGGDVRGLLLGVHKAVHSELGMPVAILEALDVACKRRGTMTRLEVRMAADAVAIGYPHKSLISLMFTMASRASMVGGLLLREMLGSRVAEQALTVIDRPDLVIQREYAFNGCPGRVALGAVVLEHLVRRAQGARFVNATLPARRFETQPRQNCDSQPQRRPPRHAPQTVGMPVRFDFDTLGKLTAAVGDGHGKSGSGFRERSLEGKRHNT